MNNGIVNNDIVNNGIMNTGNRQGNVNCNKVMYDDKSQS